MNLKVAVTVPIAIILFVFGVSCPPTDENEFPSRYPLQSCRSNFANLQLDSPGSTFEIVQDEQRPMKYCLIQTLTNSSRPREYCFRKHQVQFYSMKDAEVTMMIFQSDDPNPTWNITCVYPSVELARKFYKDLTRGLVDELIPFLWVISVNSNGIALINRPRLHVNCFENYATIVLKSTDDEEVLSIFPVNGISQVTPVGDTEIDVYIRWNPNDAEPALYKFVCDDDSDATAVDELLHRLRRNIGVTTVRTNSRPFSDEYVKLIFERLEDIMTRRVRRLDL